MESEKQMVEEVRPKMRRYICGSLYDLDGEERVQRPIHHRVEDILKASFLLVPPWLWINYVNGVAAIAEII